VNTTRFSHLAINDTLPKLVRHNAQAHGAEIAQREKELGLWKSYTWAGVNESAKLWALGLEILGVVPGDTVAIIGDARPHWIAAAIGTQAVRAASLGLYQDALDAEINFLVSFAEAKVVVAENEEQVDKILRVTAGVSSRHAEVHRSAPDPSRSAVRARTTAGAEYTRCMGCTRRCHERQRYCGLVFHIGHYVEPKTCQHSRRSIHSACRQLLRSAGSGA
jgi:long-subunit acyl-CoA synthetase (AMP-forming)